ncbi:hypothetical protein AN964_17070 [Heyndrickxia shackletonii]|uniref:Uncharacterized protein n=1 Tax=Heyndrickxia shackletonii TaxID=157838 RepID=A0A0Q3TM48_9BACI|nr:hypothetical protein [Heyndrickxia shackletonii]KQL55048.1 hypothetical protein AN964_17070 [Heyndrickxia shackletonii]NEZ02138.1 hypothetical protein [Heyndrickxia shackletonii]
MTNENQFSHFVNDPTVQSKMEKVWVDTCGSWQNCTEETIQAFLAGCEEYSIDPQYCMSWVEQHQAQIPNWSSVSQVSLNWMNTHTSTGSPISANKDDFQ